MKNILRLSILSALLIISASHTNAQVINTYAGNGTPGFSGDGGAATAAELHGPWGVAADVSGNVYISDFPNYRIRMVNATTGIITTLAGTGVSGYTGDGGPATAAKMTYSSDLAVYGSNVFFIDLYNCVVREVSGGIIKTVVGTGTCGYSGDGGQATAAKMGVDNGIAVDASGNLYITEQSAEVIRKVNMSTGIISTIAGTPYGAGYSGDGGPATAAKFNLPNGIVVDGSGNIYMSDNVNNAIRRIDGTTNIITTVAGSGVAGYSGDGGAATAATLHDPGGVDYDASGNIYFGDSYNNVVRMVNTSGIISTWAGTGTAGFTGDGGAPSSAELNYPDYLAHDACGNVYIDDISNNRIRVVNQSTVTGPSSVCVGATITLSDPLGAGTWSSSNTAIATVGSGSGVVTGVSAGVVTISYTLSAGCAGAKTITVNPLPTLFTIVGGGSYCAGGTGVMVGLSGSTTGVSYQLYNGVTAVGTPVSGIGGAISFGLQTAVGTYTIVATNSITGCKSTMTGVAVIITNPLPIVYPVYIGAPGIDSICSGASGCHIILGGSQIATSYQLVRSGIPTGIVVSGTGLIVDFGCITIPGVYTIFATNTVTGCSNVMGPVTILPIPAAIAGPDSLCAASTMTITDVTSGGTWSSSNMTIATVGSSGVVSGLATGTDTIRYTVSTGCAATRVITVNPLPTLYPLYIGVSGVYTMCSSSTGNHIILGGSQLGVMYQLWMGGMPESASMPGTGGIIDFGAYTVPGTYTVIATTAAGCENIMGPVNILPAVAPITGVSTVCVGYTTTLTDITGGGAWSASNGNAAIGSVSGSVMGVTAGLDTMTYTLSSGCTAFMVIAVNPSPGLIIVPPTVCAGSSVVAFCAAGGGLWSGIGTSLTVGSSTGIVTGIGLGVGSICYTLPTGCSSCTPVTTNPLPAPIAGASSVCVGGTTLFTSTSAGGTWSASNAHASVGTGSGLVTGVSTGTTTITYTLPTGCYATKMITVNTTASVITGTLQVCVGMTTALSDSATGITWSSSATAIATIGSSTGIVTGVSAGTVIITCVAGSGCMATAVVTVNPLPTLYTVTGGGSYCAGGTGVHIGTSGSVTGVSYQLYSGGIAVGSAMLGTGASLDFGLQTAAGTYIVVATITATGCTRTMTGSVSIIINPLPLAIGGPSALCAGTTIAETDGTGGGVWSSSAPTIAGIGSTGIVSGHVIGTTTITYMLPTGCFIAKTVTVSASPTTVSGVSTICANDSTTLTDTIGGGIWTSSATVVATVGSLTGVVTGHSAGIVTITYSLGTGCIATKAMTVNASPALITGTMGLCVGHTTTLSCTTPGGTWTSGATTIATIGSTGIVNGVSAGTAGISYTLASGCKSTATVSVNALPATITGTMHVCIAATTLLSDATGGGAWTSATTGIATVGSGTGVVTGMTAGTTTITYSLGAGCIATAPVTVNSNPSGIGGASIVCAGAMATVTDGTTGGTWSSPSTGIATIGSTTGAVAGISGGVAIVSYTLATGCMATKPVTVNALPGAISGAPTVCVGQNTTLSDGTAGGTWSSSNTAVATVGSASGVVFGVATGTATITYLLPTGCLTTIAIAVTTPSTIVGAGSVCAGSTTTLSDAVTGGVWSSGLPGIATIGSSSGVVTGVSGGTVGITYTPGAGCSVTKTVTVNPLPSAITGTPTICVGTTTTLSDPTGGGMWNSSNTAVASVGSGTGIVTGVNTGTANIIYSISTGCKATLLMSVNPGPYSITGPGSTVCGGHTIALSDATTGGIWSSSNTSIATVSTTGVVTGGTTGGSVTISYTISTSCAATRTISVTVVPPITGLTNLCAWGDTVTVHDANVTGLYSSTLVTAVNMGSGTGIVTSYAAGTGRVSYTLPSGCFVSATMTVYPIPGLITGPNHIAVGGTTTLTNPIPGGMWSSGAPAIATVGSVTGLVTGVAAGAAHITYTLPTGCNADTIVYVATARTSGPGYQATTGGGEITVIPNPNKGAFTVSGTLETTAKQDGEVWLELTNILGQVVYKNKVLCHNGKIEEDVSVSNIANGMYLLSVRWEDGSKVMHVVVNP